MASTNSTSTEPDPLTPTAVVTDADAALARAASKRYEALLTVRTRAIKGKGAWYWAHLEPLLIRTAAGGSGGSSAVVKLRCSLCDAVFSASNPSRTASEHLKRGTCPNVNNLSVLPSPSPVSSVSVAMVSNSNNNNNHCYRNKKRNSPHGSQMGSYQNHNLAMVELGYSHLVNNNYHNNGQNQNNQNNLNQSLVLSGGKEDLRALAVFEQSVNKLKCPKNNASSSPSCGDGSLTKEQVGSAVEFLADWFFESCGSVSLSTLEHPKFQAFLSRVGFPAAAAATLRREITGPKLESRFCVARDESEARTRDAMFFQVCSDGWKSKDWFGLCCVGCEEGESLVKFTVNLPNGTSVFQKALFTGGVGVVSSKYAEEVLWETVKDVTGNVVQRCVGIMADKFKAKALRNLEVQNHWMVNISCQVQGFISLIKDFSKELLLFQVVIENCLRVANFFNGDSQVRGSFLRYQMQELEYAGLVRVPSPKCDPLKNFASVFPMLEDILSCARVIQMVTIEETFKAACMEDPLAREVAQIIQNEGFWNEVEAVYSLVKLIRGMVQDIETERPLISRCLPLWEELRSKVKEWCVKYNVLIEPLEKIIEKRFRKNYHPAWSAAFILDPLHLIKDTSGKYLPPFKCLTREQEKDVDKLLTRLASREEAHVVLMELMKWRSEGLDPLYAQAVQMKQLDPVTGKMKLANPLSSRIVWETCLSDLKSLGKIAVRLIFMHATSCGFKSNGSFMKKISAHKNSRISFERAHKMVYIAAHAKLERLDFSDVKEKDAELLAMTSSEDGMLAEVFADAPLV